MTSSLIQSVPKTSRAICAVVTASFTVWQPAVFGRTRTPSSRISAQKRLTGRAAGRFAAQRDGDDLDAGARGPPRRGWRATDIAPCRGRAGFAARSRRRMPFQPPCIGATTSMRSPSFRSLRRACGPATKSPFTAVATIGRHSRARPAPRPASSAAISWGVAVKQQGHSSSPVVSAGSITASAAIRAMAGLSRKP